MGSSDALRPVRVERIGPLDPTMTRVTFGMVDGQVSETVRAHAGHCRLHFPDAGGSAVWPRVFTYRRWHPDGRFDVDFALHGGNGPAARWLARARPGDIIGWRHGGPPKLSLERPRRDPVVLFADASALPVVSALVEQAHRELRGHVILDLAEAADPGPLDAPAGVPVRVLRPSDGIDRGGMLHGLRLPPAATLFVACEAGMMRRLRRIALADLDVPRERVFASGYWKAGLSTEEVDQAKRRPEWFDDERVRHRELPRAC